MQLTGKGEPGGRLSRRQKGGLCIRRHSALPDLGELVRGNLRARGEGMRAQRERPSEEKMGQGEGVGGYREGHGRRGAVQTDRAVLLRDEGRRPRLADRALSRQWTET